MRKPCTAALAAAIFASAPLFAAEGASAAGMRLVRGTGYGTPDNWKVKTLLGHDLYWQTVINCKTWMEDWSKCPDLAMTRHIWGHVYGWFGINDLAPAVNFADFDPKKVRFAQWVPQSPDSPVKWRNGRDRTWHSFPAKFTDLLNERMGGEAQLQRFLEKYPNHPFHVWCPDVRPYMWLKKSFDTDHASLEAWKKDHPSFIGCEGLSEFDGEFAAYDNTVMPKIKAQTPDIYERIAREFPLHVDARGINDRAVEAARRISSFYFGEKRLCALVSNCPARLFTAARAGSGAHLTFEAALGSCSGPFRLGGIYMRGCSRQYDVDMCWYQATWMHNCFARDGSNQPGDLQWPHGKKGSKTAEKFKPYHGAPRSLLNRSTFYGLMIGSIAFGMEKWTDFFMETKNPDDLPRPSCYMLDYNRVFEINDEIDRGFPFTPCAMLFSLDEPYNRSSYTPRFKDRFSQMAFYNTVIPMHVREYESRFMSGDRKRGDVGCMWNSEFGEFFDALCPDADQESAKFLKVLSDYKAAILVGWFNKKHFDAGAVESYVKNGGTLFADSDKLDQGLVTAEMAGVSFSAEKTAAADDVFAADGKTPAFKFGEAYSVRKATPTTAKPVLVDANGAAVAWANDFGKGRVVTVAVDRLLPDSLGAKRLNYENEAFAITSNSRQFPLIAYLLRRMQDETLPVKVEGDIQWGVNKTKSGWLVWLINNKGVVKFAGEPEELDPKAASTVRVTFKTTGRVYEKTVAPGGYGWIAIDAGEGAR